MRIVSLLPSATEIVFALGLGDELVGVTHECDYPPDALALPHLTRDELPPGLDSAQIDAAVRERTERGDAIYGLDEQLLRELEPDLIVTQELCPVCAVSYDEVQAIAQKLPVCPQVIALDPRTFGETMVDVRTVAQATGALADRSVDLGGAQPRRQLIARDLRQLAGGWRVVALMRDADHVVAEAEREQQLGCVGDKAHDAHRGIVDSPP